MPFPVAAPCILAGWSPRPESSHRPTRRGEGPQTGSMPEPSFAQGVRPHPPPLARPERACPGAPWSRVVVARRTVPGGVSPPVGAPSRLAIGTACCFSGAAAALGSPGWPGTGPGTGTGTEQSLPSQRGANFTEFPPGDRRCNLRSVGYYYPPRTRTARPSGARRAHRHRLGPRSRLLNQFH